MAGFPLFAVAVSHGNAAEAARWAATLLAEWQQPLPETLVRPLRAGLDLAATGASDHAMAQFEEALGRATELHYL
jgi:hypothetical protein